MKKIQFYVYAVVCLVQAQNQYASYAFNMPHMLSPAESQVSQASLTTNAPENNNNQAFSFNLLDENSQSYRAVYDRNNNQNDVVHSDNNTCTDKTSTDENDDDYYYYGVDNGWIESEQASDQSVDTLVTPTNSDIQRQGQQSTVCTHIKFMREPGCNLYRLPVFRNKPVTRHADPMRNVVLQDSSERSQHQVAHTCQNNTAATAIDQAITKDNNESVVHANDISSYRSQLDNNNILSDDNLSCKDKKKDNHEPLGEQNGTGMKRKNDVQGWKKLLMCCFSDSTKK